ncbi:hypothetical protein [Streptomyces violarus]|uniref:hypothetical protein n=1 Tax=Streptomyces violarus TaxID=67380 RepID=UPI0021BE4028|nr:hypothetical protein [Streptomyces violarus]MCT9138308.1 hypothetical protein [Streptomyces violarus]
MSGLVRGCDGDHSRPARRLYLVHVRLAPHPSGTPLPLGVASVITQAAPPDTAILHATVHPSDGPVPAVGIFLESAAPELAESAARVAWWTAVGAQPHLAEWALLSASVSLAPGTAW